MRSSQQNQSGNSNDVVLRKDGYPQVKSLIESIENDRYADAFREPVPWEDMQLLDYPQIVKNPMDLLTVKEKLMAGKYGTYEEVFGEVQLIWDNCKLYNMAGSEIYKICERMEKTAKRMVQKFRTAHGLPTPPEEKPSNLRKRNATRQAAQPASNTQEKSQTNSTGGPSGQRGGAERGRGVADNANNIASSSNLDEINRANEAAMESNFGVDPQNNANNNAAFGQEKKVTGDMKMDFVQKVKKLSNEGLTKLVKQVQETAPEALLQMDDQERVQIRVNELQREQFDAVLESIEETLISELPSKRFKTSHQID